MTSTSQSGESARHAAIGTLFAGDGLSVPVSITQRSEDILLVILEGGDEFTSGSLVGLILESTGGRGVLRTQGAAEQIEPNLLRFVIDESPDMVQRREFVRVTVAKRVVLEDEEGEVFTEGLTVDISGGGMLVNVRKPEAVPDDQEIYFSLYLGLTDYDDQVSGLASIVRRHADGRIGLGYKDISRRDQERLIRFVFERQRVALAMTRGDTA
jgi:PilZ domain